MPNPYYPLGEENIDDILDEKLDVDEDLEYERRRDLDENINGLFS